MPKKKWESITKAVGDNREYRVIECNNGLVAALISDSKTDKAAIALTVQVGSGADPDELQGLAHFLEHMLFLGSEKFPAENDYKKFLIEHGGAANASTYVDKTTYYLTVSPQHLEGALERFSQFFIRPLLNPDMTDREVNAVSMECERNRKIDCRRLMRLEKWLSKPGNPYQKFSTGNKKLLESDPRNNGVNVRNELLNFHAKWYSANIMKLAVIGQEPLDDLEEKVSVFFSEVIDKRIKPYTLPEPPYTDQQKGIMYYTSPIKNTTSLTLMFPCPDYTEYYASGPVVYVKYIMSRTSKGSLYSYLRRNFWIDSKIESGLQVISSGIGKFHIKFNLTEEGLANYEEIIHAAFQYVNMIRTECINETIWKECARIADINFEYKENPPPQTLVLNLVEQLIQVPYEDILVSEHKLTEWNPDIIKQLLSHIRPQNARIRLVSKKYENSLKDEDPIYGVKYKIERIPPPKMQQWSDGSLRGDFKIPPNSSSANKMIPENFDLIPMEYPFRTQPEILLETKHSRVWYMADRFYFLPKAYFRLNIFSVPSTITPLLTILSCIMISKMEDEAVEMNWDADAAGMSSKIQQTSYGWQISVSGYSDKIIEYFKRWAKIGGGQTYDHNDVNMRKETLARMLMNKDLDAPTQQSDKILRILTNETKWTTEELLGAIDCVSLEHLESLYNRSIVQAFCEALVYGNITKEAARMAYQEFRDNLPTPIIKITAGQMRENRETIFPKGNLLYVKEEDVHTSSCTLVYFHLGMYNHELAATAELFFQYIKEPVFSVLRTREQLAYTVQRGVDRTAGCLGLFVRLLTEKHPRYADDRIEKLLLAMGAGLENLDDQTLETHKQSLIDVKTTIPKKMTSKCEELYEPIKSRRYDFGRKDKEIAVVRRLKKGDLMDFYENYIMPDGPNRRRLSIHIRSNVGDQPIYTDGPQSLHYKEIKDFNEFKNSCQLYPLTYVINPRTVID